MPTQPPRVVLVLSENWTFTDPCDLRALVRIGQVAEDAGVDALMVSEHVAMGPAAGAQGVMANPRDYALPGNQDPTTPWPDSIVLLSALAAVTTRVRLAACAVIAPLRHPVLLAKQLGTLDLLSEGRLVVQPTVSWHEDEYAALGVPFRRRGRLLDQHLAAWQALWGPSPASFAGEDYAFDDVYVDPKPYRAGGPQLWLGGQSVHDRLLERIVRYADGFHPLGTPSADDMRRLADGLAAVGRDVDELELVGGIRPTFPDDRSPAPLELALEEVPEKVAAGFRTICFKPNQYTDDVRDVGELSRRVVAAVEAAAR